MRIAADLMVGKGIDPSTPLSRIHPQDPQGYPQDLDHLSTSYPQLGMKGYPQVGAELSTSSRSPSFRRFSDLMEL